MVSVLRSLVFYLVFYLGSIGIVIAAVIAALFNVDLLYAIAKIWTGYHRICVHYLLGITIKEEGVRPAGPVLYAMKHESFFEAIDMPHMFDRPAVFAKEELFRIPGWGRAARAYGLVSVARTQGASTLRTMIKEGRAFAAAGRSLAIFPEGTRVPYGRRAPLQAGFAGIYKMMGLMVVPVAVDSGPLYHRRWKKSGTITYRFGEPIPAGLPREEVEARVLDAINALNPQEPNP